MWKKRGRIKAYILNDCDFQECKNVTTVLNDIFLPSSP